MGKPVLRDVVVVPEVAASQQYFSLRTNQPAVLLSQNKAAPVISHNPNEWRDPRRTCSGKLPAPSTLIPLTVGLLDLQVKKGFFVRFSVRALVLTVGERASAFVHLNLSCWEFAHGRCGGKLSSTPLSLSQSSLPDACSVFIRVLQESCVGCQACSDGASGGLVGNTECRSWR
jgi:hypothetical protein